jgi:hypothetical protein
MNNSETNKEEPTEKNNSHLGIENIILDDKKINYEQLKTGNKEQAIQQVVNYEFFISHASLSTDIKENEKQPLEGENEFVKSLVSRLELYKKGSTFVDYKDNKDFEFKIFHTALKTSRYGIFICSPRFISRYLGKEAAPLKEEVKQFWTFKNTHNQPERLIPIIFGVTIFEYDQGPFSSSDFKMDAKYNILSMEEMVNKIVSEIIIKISG